MRLTRPVEADLTISKLLDVKFRPYCSQTYQPQEAGAVALIGSDGDMRNSPQQTALARLFPAGHFAFRSTDVGTQMALAQAGAGIAMLPDFLKPEKSDLIQARPHSPPLVREAWLVVHHDLRSSAPARAITDHLHNVFSATLQENF